MADDISTLLNRYKELNLQNVLDHERFIEYSIVHHSSSIEGSTLTEIETRLLLEEDITPKGKPLMHSLMVKDHYTALRYVLDAAATHRLPLAIVFKEDKADYYVALQETRKQEDMQVFYAFMFGQYRKHLEQEISSYTQAMYQKTEPKKGKGSGYSLFF